jgi:hypothetical protein
MSDTPIRPQTHITGDVGQTAIALVFKEWGWTADIVQSDYGEDVDCNIFVDHRKTAFRFRCQVKSTADADNSVRQLASGDFCISIATSTCQSWLLSYFPVLLIVYDLATKEAVWANASAQIQDNLTALSQEAMTFHIPRENVLRKSAGEILAVVQNFYARLLRLSSTTVECEMFPVFMPGYRALGLRDYLDARVSAWPPESIELEDISRDIDSLPAWAGVLRTLEGPFLPGWDMKHFGDNLQGFVEMLRRALGDFPISVSADEWIVFLCSPIRFSAKDDVDTRDTFWNRELTDWWAYARLGSEVVSDGDYAFAIPRGFLRQIGGHAQSWEGLRHVDPQRNVCIQLLASAATTPGCRAQASILRQHMLGQFLPWTCPNDAISQLQAMVRPLQLVFREVEGAPRSSGSKVGAICALTLRPSLGAFSQARNWTEFTQGSVHTLLDEAGLLDRLPGRGGPQEVTDIILKMFSGALADLPDQLLLTEYQHVSGLPLDHRNRVVVVERFGRTDSSSTEKADQVLTELKEQISSASSDLRAADASWQTIDFAPYEITQLSVSWVPSLDESSRQSFEGLAPIILNGFDRILPREAESAGHFRTTQDVLRRAGRVYFEGDRLWKH